MKKYKRRKKKKSIIPILVITLFLAIPCVYAFYFSKYESSIISKFIFNNKLSTSYVRSTIITYWVDINNCTNEEDLTTCDISGKSSWTMNSSVINSDWYALDDGYYYYKDSIGATVINKDNIKTSNIALINPELNLSDLTVDHLAGTGIVPQYEIIYEFIEEGSIEDSWKVTYKDGIPTIIE